MRRTRPPGAPQWTRQPRIRSRRRSEDRAREEATWLKLPRSAVFIMEKPDLFMAKCIRTAFYNGKGVFSFLHLCCQPVETQHGQPAHQPPERARNAQKRNAGGGNQKGHGRGISGVRLAEGGNR